MTRNRIKRRREASRRRDLDLLGRRVRRLRGICRGCGEARDLVHGHQLCLICYVRLSRQAS